MHAAAEAACMARANLLLVVLLMTLVLLPSVMPFGAAHPSTAREYTERESGGGRVWVREGGGGRGHRGKQRKERNE